MCMCMHCVGISPEARGRKANKIVLCCVLVAGWFCHTKTYTQLAYSYVVSRLTLNG